MPIRSLGYSEQQDGSFDIFDRSTNTRAKVYANQNEGEARDLAQQIRHSYEMYTALIEVLGYTENPYLSFEDRVGAIQTLVLEILERIDGRA